jgi:putative ABC transport system substrate-binding protein
VKRFVLTLVMLGASVTAVSAAEKIYRLGDLEPTAASAEVTRSVILPELATLGVREQVNLAVDERVGDVAALPRLAEELVLLRPDAIITFGSNAVLAAHNATSKIPIVTFGGRSDS